MLEEFVQAILSSLPLCLAVAILLASRAYAPRERRTTDRVTGTVLVSGLVIAAIIAWLRLNTALINIPTFNTYVGSATIVAVVAFLIAVWVFGARDLHSPEQATRHRVLTVASTIALALSSIFYGFTYFFMMDGIVPMGANLFDTQSLLRLSGYALGTILVIVAAWGYVVSARRVPWYVRTSITTIVFAAMIVPRALLLYQQFASHNLVPRSNLIFKMVLWIQHNEAATQLALAALIALPGIVALWTYPRTKPTNPAQVRIQKADHVSRREFFGLSVAGSVIFLGALTVGKKIADHVPELSPIEASSVEGDWVTVSRELVSDGHLHRFAYKADDGTAVRFLAIKKNDIAYGTGLDACEICGDSGYYEKNGKVICRECDVMMNIQTIGFPGGCNPIPIAYELTDDKLKFSVAELESHTQVFRS